MGAMFGLLNINKPAGMTSRDVVDRFFRLSMPFKIGHAGTLDPLATGVLLLCVGSATRLVSLLHDLDKSYRAEFLFGRRSDTDDVTGKVTVEDENPFVDRGQVEALLSSFTGRICQTPPAFSAVKINGKRAYRLARKGRKVELASREVVVHNLRLVEWKPPSFTLEIDCGSGTYIRSLGRDLGENLGVGVIMNSLVRTRIGPYELKNSCKWTEAACSKAAFEKHLLPPQLGLPHLTHVTVSTETEFDIRNGRAVKLPEVEWTPTGRVASISQTGRLIAILLPGESPIWKPRIVLNEPGQIEKGSSAREMNGDQGMV